VYSQLNGFPGKPMPAENRFAWILTLGNNTRAALLPEDIKRHNATGIFKNSEVKI
jgi:hypothetical protein